LRGVEELGMGKNLRGDVLKGYGRPLWEGACPLPQGTAFPR